MLINNAVITGSLTVNGTDVTYITGSSQISSSFLALSSSYLITSASYVVTSGSYAITSASFAQTSGSLSIRTGNLEATSSTLTSASSSFAAQSASLSTRLTTDETNITTLTNASASFAAQSASLSTRLTTDETNFSTTSGSLSTRVTNLEATSSTVSSSFASTSGSIAGRVTTIEGQYATTGSNNFTGPQFINQASNAISFTSTASLYTDGGLRVAKDSFVSGTAYFNNITVYGTSSIEYITSSQVNIGSNVITVNTDTPAIRFGGISVFDSGSTQLTGSLFWDSEKNHWIYSNPSGSAYNSAMLMNGPRNTGSLGTEQGTTNNALMKGQGGDHITSSQMIDDGTTVQIPGALQVTGSIVGSSTVTATNGLLIGNGGATATSGYVPKFTGTSTIGNSIVQDNGSTVSISTSSTVLSLDRTGAGTALIELKTNGTVRSYFGADASVPFIFFNQSASPLMQLNASGNLGLGVTPNTWTLGKSISVGDVGSAVFGFGGYNSLTSGAYFNSGWKYSSSSSSYKPALFVGADGAFSWSNAGAGTADAAITFTQAMTLSDSGNLSINNTNNTYKLDVSGQSVIRASNTNGVALQAVATDANTTIYLRPNNSGYNLISSNYLTTSPYLPLSLSGRENNTDLVLTTSGNVEIGNSAVSNLYKLDVNGTGRFTSNLLAQKVQVGTAASINDATGVGNTLQFANYSAGVFVTASADSYIYKTSSVFGGLSAQTLIFQTRSDVAGGGFAFVAGTTPSAIATISNTGAATFSSSVEARKLYVSPGGGAGSGSDGIANIQTTSSTLGETSELGLLIKNNGTSGYYSQIGFGYAESKVGAVIAGLITNGGGATSSALIFATRSTTTGSDAPTERMRIWSSGNVNIGTTPASDSGYKLDVNGTGRFSGTVIAGNVIYLIGSENNSAKIKAGKYLSIADDGFNVGIGYSSDTVPFSKKLSINGDLYVSGTSLIDGAATFSSSVTATQGRIRENLVNSTTIGSLDVQKTGESAINILGTTYSSIYFGDGANHLEGGIVYEHSTNTLEFRRSGNVNALTIASTGNVGIGTVSPNLSGGASGTTVLTVSATTSARNALLELNGTRTNSTDIVGYVRFFNNGAATPLADIRAERGSSDTVGDLVVTTSNTERLRIASTGAATFSSSIASSISGSGDNTFLLATGTGTGARSMYIANDGAAAIFGIEKAAGGAILGGSSAYASVLYSNNATPLQLGTNQLVRMTITSGGNVNIAGSASSNTRLTVTGVDSTSSNYGLIVNNTAQLTFGVRNDGLIYTGTAANSPYNNTTGGGANAIFAIDGTLQRSTSSLKYKTDVRNYDKGLAEVMSMRPVYYKCKNDGETQFAGLIAEEVHELGLTEFVQYAEDGSPDALSYGNMIALAFKAIQELSAKVDAQAAEINELKNK